METKQIRGSQEAERKKTLMSSMLWRPALIMLIEGTAPTRKEASFSLANTGNDSERSAKPSQSSRLLQKRKAKVCQTFVPWPSWS